jgi:hypothetical protein
MVIVNIVSRQDAAFAGMLVPKQVDLLVFAARNFVDTTLVNALGISSAYFIKWYGARILPR